MGSVEDVLESCLQEIVAGRATVDDCVERYPEVGPLLRAAKWAQAIERPSLAPQARAQIEAQLLDAVENAPFVEPARLRLNVSRLWRWAATGLALLCVVACLSAVGLLAAANSALPGSPLYPVKLATEEAWLWRTPGQDKAALHLRLARRRLDEVQALNERGQFDAGALAASTEELEAALVGLEKLDEKAARPLLDKFLQALDEQSEVLATLVAGASPAEREQLARALQAGDAQRARAWQLLGTFLPPREPDDADRATFTPSPIARVTVWPSHTPSPASNTPKSTAPWTPTSQTKTPAATLQPTALPLKSTPAPAPTATTTPRPTETQAPTPTPVPPSATFTPGAETQDKTVTNTPTGTPRPTATARPANAPSPTLTMTATMTPVPSATPPPASQTCVQGHGYWKNHLDLWPVSTLLLGKQSYPQSELSAILKGSVRADASLSLARQLIAARLNVAGGADDSAIASTLTAADDWLGNYTSRLPYHVSPDSLAGQQAASLADTLEQYNEGALPNGPPPCP